MTTPPSPDLSFGYGAANLGNLYSAMDDGQARAILDAAWDAGVRYFDTAPHYGLGLSERRLGEFLRTKPRDEYVISTKAGRLIRSNADRALRADTAHDFAVETRTHREWDFSAGGIERSLDESLERLGLDRVDILFLHDPEKHSLDLAASDAYPALEALRDRGRVDAVGVGSMSIEALSRAASRPSLDLLMIAGRLSLLEQEVLRGVVPACVRNDISIVAAGVFNSGLLASPSPSASSRYEYREAPAEVVEKAALIAGVCERFGTDLPTAAIQFPRLVERVVGVVVGGSTPAHVTVNAERMDAAIPGALWPALADLGLLDPSLAR